MYIILSACILNTKHQDVTTLVFSPAACIYCWSLFVRGDHGHYLRLAFYLTTRFFLNIWYVLITTAKLCYC